MGACLLSEANDLKRPLPIVAQELDVSLEKLERLLQGDLEVSEALGVLRRMSEVYPVPLNDLWLEADDTNRGVCLCTAGASEASSRILHRPDRTGGRAPYYEYRDLVMSRCSQFRPEWIKGLRLVTSQDPLDPDVQLNNGHLMMQTTLCIGPMDFYYRDRHGRMHRQEMQTGDSNYISPFVPHSFARREESPDAIIIAVTYGGNVRRALPEFARVGARQVLCLAGDFRDPAEARRCVLQRHLEAECLTPELFVPVLVKSGISQERARDLLSGAEASATELEAMARALTVRPSDLLVCPLDEGDEVVVTKAAESQAQARRLRTYTLAPLARTRHQPDLKTFDMEVLDSARPGEVLRCGLHTFVYHFGTEPVEMCWERRGQSESSVLRPGDSAYISPCVEHHFSVTVSSAERPNPNGAASGLGRRLLLVRIPGHLTGETLAEFATFSAYGRERVGAETMQWYN